MDQTGAGEFRAATQLFSSVLPLRARNCPATFTTLIAGKLCLDCRGLCTATLPAAHCGCTTPYQRGLYELPARRKHRWYNFTDSKWLPHNPGWITLEVGRLIQPWSA